MAIVDIVDLVDEPRDQILVRYPENGEADLPPGTHLVVPKSQVCIFSRGGQVLDSFGPGRYELSADNLPRLFELLEVPLGVEPVLQAECYFINLRPFTDRTWETSEPIRFADEVLGEVGLSASGLQSFRVSDPQLFLKSVIGAGRYQTRGVVGLLQGIIGGRLTEALSNTLKTLLDLAALYDELCIATRTRTRADYASYGLELEHLEVSTITPPPAVQAQIDNRAGLGLLEHTIASLHEQQLASALRDMSQAPEQGYPMAGHPEQGYPQQPGHPAQQHGYPQPGDAAPQSGFVPRQPPTPRAPTAPQSTYCGGCAQPLTPGLRFCAHCGAPVVG